MAKVEKECSYLDCNNTFQTTEYLLSIKKGSFCSKICCDKAKVGKKHSEEHRNKQSQNSFWKGKKRPPFSEEWKMKISLSHKGLHAGEKNFFFGKPNSGPNNPRWISDRSQLAKKQERNDSSYREWRTCVYKRDSYKCRINNEECSGRIEAHHILRWSEYPEVRYNIDNGISLCKYHHPRTRKKEDEMVNVFKEIIN